MKSKLFSVYDVKAEMFQKPFIAVAEGEAIRSFVDVCKDKSHPLGQHPEDYSLFHIGFFSDSSGGVEDRVNFCLITGLEACGEGNPIGELEVAN